jgi:glycine/D-amino acid oxidase-like deaminating enzyme
MPGYGAQYWAERTASARRRSYPKYRGDTTADVVVIGGGLTGCTIAFALAGAGLDVVLVEAERLAGGSTAGSLGAILPSPDATFRAVTRAAGLRVARAAWKAAHRSALEFASALKKLGIRCDLAPSSFVTNATAEDDVHGLRREQTARKAAALDAPWLAGPAAAASLGTASRGALHERHAFVFDPVRAALGLAGAAASRGARIFEHARVVRTRFTRKEARVFLQAGVVITRGVVVATGDPGALFGQLRRHVRRRDGYVVVTSPWTSAMRREAGKRDAVITEAGAEPHWIRWLSDDRALFAGALGRPAGTRQRDKVLVQRTGQLMYELSIRYPAISGLPAQWAWDVPVVSTPDGLPWIGPHRNYPFHFFAMAFGWHADGLAWQAARSAVRYFRNEGTRDDDALGFARYL